MLFLLLCEAQHSFSFHYFIHEERKLSFLKKKRTKQKNKKQKQKKTSEKIKSYSDKSLSVERKKGKIQIGKKKRAVVILGRAFQLFLPLAASQSFSSVRHLGVLKITFT